MKIIQTTARSHADKILKRLTTNFPNFKFELEFELIQNGALVAFRFPLLSGRGIMYHAKRFYIFSRNGYQDVNYMVSEMERFLDEFEKYDLHDNR